MIGKLERVPLRDVWRHEMLDFSRWLTKNVDVLCEVIGQRVFIRGTEAAVGKFSVDLIGEDETGNTIIIENQLERGDHQHLGQLITYAVALEAATVIWIVASANSQHIAAINSLNRCGLAAFYMVRLEAVKIDRSRPAPLMTLITGPNRSQTAAAGKKREMGETENDYQIFWTRFLQHLRPLTSLFDNVSPSRTQCLTASAGSTGISYVARLTRESASVEVSLSRLDSSENRLMLEFLHSNKDKIEALMRAGLEWDLMLGKLSCRIRYTLDDGGYLTPAEGLDMIAERMAKAMAQLEFSIDPYLGQAIDLNKIM